MKIFGCKCDMKCCLIAAALGFVICFALVKASVLEPFAPLDYTVSQGVHTDKYKQVHLPYDTNLKPTVPLPEGQLFFFANHSFKPSCCKNSTVSNSQGCACTTTEGINYIASRGGNKSGADPF